MRDYFRAANNSHHLVSGGGGAPKEILWKLANQQGLLHLEQSSAVGGSALLLNLKTRQPNQQRQQLQRHPQCHAVVYLL